MLTDEELRGMLDSILLMNNSMRRLADLLEELLDMAIEEKYEQDQESS